MCMWDVAAGSAVRAALYTPRARVLQAASLHFFVCFTFLMSCLGIISRERYRRRMSWMLVNRRLNQLADGNVQHVTHEGAIVRHREVRRVVEEKLRWVEVFLAAHFAREKPASDRDAYCDNEGCQLHARLFSSGAALRDLRENVADVVAVEQLRVRHAGRDYRRESAEALIVVVRVKIN